jgi:hypothetical protein
MMDALLGHYGNLGKMSWPANTASDFVIGQGGQILLLNSAANLLACLVR